MYIHSPTDSTHADFLNTPSTEDLHNPENALFIMIVKKDLDYLSVVLPVSMRLYCNTVLHPCTWTACASSV